MDDRQQRERPFEYPHGWAFLGNALIIPRQTFDLARNVRYWWLACGLTVVAAILDYLADPSPGLPMLVDVPLYTGLGLLVSPLVTAVARGVCGGYGADVGATASQAALVSIAINLPWSALRLAIGADAVLVTAAGVVCLVACVAYLTVLFSTAFEVGNGRAFCGVVVGGLAFLVIVLCMVGCLGLLAGAGAGP